MGIRISGFPEATDLTEDDKFIVDSATNGTKSIRKEKVKELLGGGEAKNPFKRIFQAEAVITSKTSMTLTLPLKIEGCNTEAGPLDQGQTSEYLLPGDVFFTEVEVEDNVEDNITKISNFKIIGVDKSFDFSSSPLVISPGIQASRYITHSNAMIGYRNPDAYTPIYNKNLSVSYLRTGKKTFSILVYQGCYDDRLLFVDLTSGYIGKDLLSTWNNSLYYHSFCSGEVTKYGYKAAVTEALSSLASINLKMGAYFIYVVDRALARPYKPIGVSIYYAVPYGNGTNGNIMAYSVYSTGTKKHKLFYYTNTFELYVENVDSANVYGQDYVSYKVNFFGSTN